MCRLLKVNRSSFYRWCARQDRPPTPRTQRHQEVTAAIHRVYADAAGRVGRRQVRMLLQHEGRTASLGMVHRIMQEAGLAAARVRAYRRTTVQDPAARTAHIRDWCLDASGRRSFASAVPGTKCVGDITYIRTGEGWMYQAVVLDLATRAVIGWSLQEQARTRLVIDALAMARTHGQLQHEAIFHSDRGAQYTSEAFQTWCREEHVTQSMGRTGVCWDNAVAESFFATLKGDLMPHTSFATKAAARRAIVTYIEGWYNRRRPHQHNAGTPPMVALAHWPTSSLSDRATYISPNMLVSVS